MKRRDVLKLLAAAAASPPLALAESAPTRGASAVRAASEPRAYLDAIFDGMRLYWGDIHGHTAYSDGYGTPQMAYRYARARRNLDFAAVTDHAEWMNYFGRHLPMQDGSPVPLWADARATADALNEPGLFVTLPGFEWTCTTFGHRQVLFRDSRDVPAIPPDTFSHPTPPDLWAALKPHAAMTISHHPLRWGHLTNWDYYNPETDRLVEIYSKWGNSASVWTPYEPFMPYRRYPFMRPLAEASSVDAMLARGYHIGIIAGTDTHQGQLGSTYAPEPGRGKVLAKKRYPHTGEEFLNQVAHGYVYENREALGGGGGLAGVWSTELTREAIWDGLYARRTCGSTGIRPVIKFAAEDTLNADELAVMGDVLAVSGAPVVRLSAQMPSGTYISQLQLHKNDKLLATLKHPTADVALRHTDNSLRPGETACYRGLITASQSWWGNSDGDYELDYDPNHGQFTWTRVAQTSEQVWTSPIWITRRA
ncbi:MAG: DUF3604 domain-containing protein [Lentisphaerae bacterium]|nr:DUF3604 domain-containing protein [Lentisphaerota bacterium]